MGWLVHRQEGAKREGLAGRSPGKDAGAWCLLCSLPTKLVLGSAWKDGLPRNLRGTRDPWSLRKVQAQVSACLCGIMSSGLLAGLEGNQGLLDVSRPVGLKRQGQVYCDTGSP